MQTQTINTFYAALADWQAATAQDAHAVAGDPGFVDLDGADNVLGYAPVGSGFRDGPCPSRSLNVYGLTVTFVVRVNGRLPCGTT